MDGTIILFSDMLRELFLLRIQSVISYDEPKETSCPLFYNINAYSISRFIRSGVQRKNQLLCIPMVVSMFK